MGGFESLYIPSSLLSEQCVEQDYNLPLLEGKSNSSVLVQQALVLGPRDAIIPNACVSSNPEPTH